MFGLQSYILSLLLFTIFHTQTPPCTHAHHRPDSDIMRMCRSIPVQIVRHFLLKRCLISDPHRAHHNATTITKILTMPSKNLHNNLHPTTSPQMPQPQPTTSTSSPQPLQPLPILQCLHHKCHSASSTSQQPLQTALTTVNSLDAHHSLKGCWGG